MKRFHQFSTALTLSGCILAGSASAAFLFGDPENGAKLHESACAGCHVERMGGDGSQMYLRSPRSVNTIEGLKGQVEGCNQAIKSNLNSDEIDDLVIYLNETYYKFED